MSNNQRLKRYSKQYEANKRIRSFSMVIIGKKINSYVESLSKKDHHDNGQIY